MLPFVSGCNDSDDVNGIFTGKAWKLTYITKKNEHKPYDFWGDKDKYEQSFNKYINKKGSIKSNNNKYLYFIFFYFFIPFLISNASIVGFCPLKRLYTGTL